MQEFKTRYSITLGLFSDFEPRNWQAEAIAKSKRIANPGCYPTGPIRFLLFQRKWTIISNESTTNTTTCVCLHCFDVPLALQCNRQDCWECPELPELIIVRRLIVLKLFIWVNGYIWIPSASKPWILDDNSGDFSFGLLQFLTHAKLTQLTLLSQHFPAVPLPPHGTLRTIIKPWRQMVLGRAKAKSVNRHRQRLRDTRLA